VKKGGRQGGSDQRSPEIKKKGKGSRRQGLCGKDAVAPGGWGKDQALVVSGNFWVGGKAAFERELEPATLIAGKKARGWAEL